MIIDAHCDALSKLYLNPQLDFYKEESELDVSFPRLQRAGMKVQFFAIYLPEKIRNPTFDHVLQFIDLFHRKIVQRPEMKFIKGIKDLESVMHGDCIGALLTLEGADTLMGNMSYLRLLFRLGVRCIGITWNYANWAADGVMEPRKGGFTIKGKRMLKEMENMGMIMDVSHLSVKGFWELAETTKVPFMASHSNAIELCPHPRNLSKEQIQAIIERNGRIGITFVPYFVDSRSPVRIDRLLKHIDYVCSLGGELNVGFGSDFDGIDQWIQGLENAAGYENLIEALCKQYSEAQVQRFLHGNWQRFLQRTLPKE